MEPAKMSPEPETMSPFREPVHSVEESLPSPNPDTVSSKLDQLFGAISKIESTQDKLTTMMSTIKSQINSTPPSSPTRRALSTMSTRTDISEMTMFSETLEEVEREEDESFKRISKTLESLLFEAQSALSSPIEIDEDLIDEQFSNHSLAIHKAASWENANWDTEPVESQPKPYVYKFQLERPPTPKTRKSRRRQNSNPLEFHQKLNNRPNVKMSSPLRVSVVLSDDEGESFFDASEEQKRISSSSSSSGESVYFEGPNSLALESARKNYLYSKTPSHNFQTKVRQTSVRHARNASTSSHSSDSSDKYDADPYEIQKSESSEAELVKNIDQVLTKYRNQVTKQFPITNTMQQFSVRQSILLFAEFNLAFVFIFVASCWTLILLFIANTQKTLMDPKEIENQKQNRVQRRMRKTSAPGNLNIGNTSKRRSSLLAEAASHLANVEWNSRITEAVIMELDYEEQRGMERQRLAWEEEVKRVENMDRRRRLQMLEKVREELA